MRYTIIFTILLFLFTTSCTKSKFSSTPSLKYESENSRVVNPGQILTFKLSFTDAEGDLTDSIIVQKNVLNCVQDTGTSLYQIPPFPTGKDQKGEILINYYYSVGGINTLGSPTCDQNDTVIYKFVLKDKAQHKSDTATSPSIIIIHQ